MIDMVEKTAFLNEPLTEKLGLLVLNWFVFILEAVTLYGLLFLVRTSSGKFLSVEEELDCGWLVKKKKEITWKAI